jgi:hypothetical protein
VRTRFSAAVSVPLGGDIWKHADGKSSDDTD